MKTAKMKIYSIVLNKEVEVQIDYSKAVDNEEFREKIILQFRNILNDLLEKSE